MIADVSEILNKQPEEDQTEICLILKDNDLTKEFLNSLGVDMNQILMPTRCYFRQKKEV